jgi:hypothetical protein
MSDTLFNYTFNINSADSQNDTIDALNKGRFVSPIPESYFFADLNNFPTQVLNDGFGPLSTDPANKFRITSKFNITTPTKAFAAVNGHLFFAPHGNSINKVNVFLKPAQPVDVGVKVKYFVYRGIKIDSLFDTDSVSGEKKLIQKNNINATEFLKRIWEEYKQLYSIDPNTAVFKAAELGYFTSPTDFGEVTEKFFKQNEYNLPFIKEGEEFGTFETTIGFEIVVDYGDYEQEKHESGFELDYDYVNAVDCVLNLSGDNLPFVAGNLTSFSINYAGISAKVFKESVYHFIDPAAFYGAHITQVGGKHGKINTNKTFNYDGGDKNYIFYQDSIYSEIVSKFITRNNIYLYIASKRGRSYNFYNETPVTATTGPIQPAPDQVDPNVPVIYPPSEDFSTNGWPIKIFDAASVPNYLSYNIGSAHNSKVRVHFLLDYLLPITTQFINNCFYIRDAFNIKRFKEYKMEIDLNHTRVALESPLFKPLSGTSLPISKFLFATYSRYVDYSKYYNDLIGPIDVSGLFEPEDFSSAQGSKIQWLIYNKPKMYHIGNTNMLGEMKVIFEGESASATRLYMIYPADSDDPNYIKRAPFLSGYDTITETNTFERIVYENKLNNQASDIRVWKGSVLDNNLPVSVLATRNLIYDSDNVSSFIQLGLTETEYNSLAVGAPDVLRFNVFFNLTELPNTSTDNYQKYQLGISYDNFGGNLVTYTASTPVIVYSIDGKFFATKEYASQFTHAETFADVAVEFLPLPFNNPTLNPTNQQWQLLYGFDWMRKVNENFGVQNYPAFRNIMGTVPAQTDGNDTTGTFVPNPVIYNNLKVAEYNAIPLNWRFNAADNDIEYFSSWMSLVKDNNKVYTIKLRMKVGTVPTSLKIPYNNSLLILSSPLDPNNSTHQNNANNSAGPNKNVSLNFDVSQLSPNAFFETTLNITLKVHDYKIIPFNKQLMVLAQDATNLVPKIAGLLNLFIDDLPKTQELFFVPITLQLPSGTVAYNQAQLPNEETNLQNYLRQSLIKTNVEWIKDGNQNPISLNIGNLPNIYFGTFNSVVNIIGDDASVPGFVPLGKYLKPLLDIHTPTNKKVIFFINNVGGNINATGNFTSLGGFATGIGSDVVVFQINPNAPTTLAHEVLHSLGLPHTFNRLSPNSVYTYQAFQTDNLMDYTPITRSIHHWQWLIARSNLNRVQ